jgi:hypothetical protein
LWDVLDFRALLAVLLLQFLAFSGGFLLAAWFAVRMDRRREGVP